MLPRARMNRSQGTDGAAFWGFSLELYGAPDVAPACLKLQDAWGADVNVVLLLLWVALDGRILGKDELTAIDQSVRNWRDDVIRPIRNVRRALKDRRWPAEREQEELRSRIKDVELESERVAQKLLLQALHECPPPPSAEAPRRAARRNLAEYAAFLGRTFPPEAERAILAAFDQLSA
jgi:uncharacterized protein (TIGR02444 family)